MPVIKKKPPEIPDRDELLGRLVEELRSPSDRGQPLILESPIGGTDDFIAYVIWERWAKLPYHLRSKIIQDAYSEMNGANPGRVPITYGFTTGEAIFDGLLPVRIEPFERSDGQCASDQLRSAMIEEGAVEAMGSLQLRFTSLEEARAAFDRLQARFPGCFRLVEEKPAPTD